MDPLSLNALYFVVATVVLLRLPLPTMARRGILLAANLAFLAIFHPFAPILFLGASLVGYFGARVAATKPSPWIIALCSLPLIALLFSPKLLFATTSSEVGNAVGAKAAIFLGASYFTLRALSFLLDARRTGKLQFGLFDFLTYNSFFPTLIAGPIERADHFAKTYDKLGRADADDVEQGLIRIGHGLFKKVVLGGLAAAWAAPLHAYTNGGVDLSTSEAWISLYAFVLYTYFDFAGYSDLALGVARLNGIKLAENFDNPFLRPSIAEFWRGWHISLSFWIRDYLFLPLCGKSKSPARPHIAALLSMTLCGLWHAPNVGWALWGLLHGMGLSVHQGWTLWLRKRFRLKVKLQKSLPFRMVAIFLTFNFVAWTWVVTLGGNDLGVSLGYLQSMLGIGK